ncbi:retrovirus-related pol polyprotein from transposon TNT 1-94 [Tanacetum coccineum]
MATHNRIYIAPSHIKKVFANMKRQEKDFSDRVTPFFSTIIVQAQQEQENAVDEAVYEEMDDSLERATTIATGLDAEQDRGNISKTQSKAIPNETSSIRTSLGGGPKRQDTIEDTIAQTRYENVSKFSNDSLLAGVNTPQSDDEASLGDQEVASKQGRKIHDIDANEDITLENVHDADMFGVHDLNGDESTKPNAVTTAATITTTAVTRPNAKGLFIQEQEQASTPITSLKDKGKGIMVEEPLKMKKKDQVLFDEQEVIRLQAQFDDEERITREKEEANATLIAQWNDIQDKVETDYEFTQRLQAEEQKELTIEEKSKLFQQLLEKRRKHFAAKRVEERRNKPPTKAQQRSIMCTYLKNMAGWKPKDLKTNKTREESSSKRAGDELEQEPSKKQKVDDDKETKELKQCMEIILDDGDDVTIEATPLSTKSPTIVDYKIYKSIVKARFKKTKPVNYMDIFLHLNLKTMFEHHFEDSVWKNQQGLVKVLNWKLYDSCRVHYVTMQNILYYLLVEKMYPLIKHTLHQIFNDVKLQVDYECEMAFKLLRLVKKQLKKGYGRIVGIKSLLKVTTVKVLVTAAKHKLVFTASNVSTARLVLLVQQLLLLVFKVNVVGSIEVGSTTPQQNGVVEWRNQTLVEAARTMLIFSYTLLFLWAKAIATACYTQNHFLIHRRFDKTPYKLINGRKLDISVLHVFGALCYPCNDREDIWKLGAKCDIGFFIGYSTNSCAYRVYNQRTKKIMEMMNVTSNELLAMAFERSSSKPELQGMTSGHISSGLALTYASSSITSQKPTAIFVNPFAPPSTSAAVSSSYHYVDPSNMHTFYQPYQHDYQWTKDHPLEQVIGEPLRPVLTRNQLWTYGEMCIYALSVSTMQQGNVKEAITDLGWIDSMQEKLL